jgi:hypothetical protein
VATPARRSGDAGSALPTRRAPKVAAGGSRRASVPSWDDIVFGAKRES